MRKSIPKLFAVCCLFLTFTSCLWFESFDDESFSEKMNTWLRHNEYILYDFWGTPSKSITYPDGTKILTYMYEYTEKIRDGWWEDRNPPPPPPPPRDHHPSHRPPESARPPANGSHHPNVRPPRNNPSNKMAPPSYERKSFNLKTFQIQPLHYRGRSIYHPPIYEDYSCQISFTIERGIVTKWSYDGDNAALRKFIKRAPFIVEIKETAETATSGLSINDILNNRLDLWIGHSRIELLKIYGTDFETEIVDNNEFLTFSDGSSCEVTFKLDSAGIIKDFSYKGELTACERFIK